MANWRKKILKKVSVSFVCGGIDIWQMTYNETLETTFKL